MSPITTRFRRLIVLAAALGWLVVGSTAWACPNCRDALAGDASHTGLAQGLYWSILLLLSMPFLILTGLGSYFYWLVYRARLAAAAADPGATGDSPFPSADAAEEPLEVARV